MAAATAQKGTAAFQRSQRSLTIGRNRGPTLFAVFGVSHQQLCKVYAARVAVRSITPPAAMRLFVTANTPKKSPSLNLMLPK
jgi:hypothetical protein